MIHLAELDVLDPEARLPSVSGELWVLVRAGGEVLGESRLRGYAPLWERERRAEIVDAFCEQLAARLAVRPKSEPDPLPAGRVSVVVSEQSSIAMLHGCLAAIALMQPQPGEVIVVGSPAAEAAAADAGARFIVGPAGRVALARNAAWPLAGGQVIGFLADTARPDRRYVGALCRAFAHDGLDALSGLVLAAELAAYPQICFERDTGGFNRGFERRLHHRDLARPDPRAFLGTYTNIAFRRRALERIGGFDPALGVGSAIGAGDALDAVMKLLAAGGVVAHEPSVIVRHVHPRTRSELLAWTRAHAAALARYRALEDGPRRAIRAAALLEIKPIARAVRHRQLLHLQLAFARVTGTLEGARAGGRAP